MSNYFSFDSKFFRTFFPVLFKPGYLTNAYRLGKRASYIPPVRLFIFVSIAFFLLMPLLPSEDTLNINRERPDRIPNGEVAVPDSLETENNEAIQFELNAFKEVGDTILIWGVPYPLFDSYAEYTAYRENLNEKPGIIGDITMRQYYKIKDEDTDRLNAGMAKIFVAFLPKLVFLVMPFFALILKLLYVRRNFYYEEHFIFALHFHSFVYLSLFALMLLGLWIDPAIWLFPIFTTLYLFIALRKVYAQRFWKTALKLLFIMLLYAVVLALGLVGGAIYTAFSY